MPCLRQFCAQLAPRRASEREGGGAGRRTKRKTPRDAKHEMVRTSRLELPSTVSPILPSAVSRRVWPRTVCCAAGRAGRVRSGAKCEVGSGGRGLPVGRTVEGRKRAQRRLEMRWLVRSRSCARVCARTVARRAEARRTAAATAVSRRSGRPVSTGGLCCTRSGCLHLS